ncbi:MAG: alpha/beta hydrolase [Proteobacteria bacterium]|nr:alpha/beta hydrolase [Pseudomonadota bacterium]
MPQSSRFTHHNATLRAEPLTDASSPLRLVWLHGWGQSRESLRPLATALSNIGESWLIDLPGHGEASPPPHAFSPANYATLLNEWLKTQPTIPTILIGHSFGFRVAVHAASQNPQAFKALAAIAGAGIPRPRTLRQNLRRQAISLLMSIAKALKPLLGEGLLQSLRQKFGSRDYLQATPTMRPTFLAVVNDNTTQLCKNLPHPTLLIYGTEDTETPPHMGQKFAKLIPHSQLHLLPGHTHYTLLQGGRHLVEKYLRHFLQSL